MVRDKIYILVPTRDRPEVLKRLVDSWEEHTEGLTELIIIIDSDQRDLYYNLILGAKAGVNIVVLNDRYKLVPKLNTIANAAMRGDFGINPLALGFVGDDCIFQSDGWEAQVLQQLEKDKGMVYCNDLLQGERLPNNIFMHKNIVKTLGFFAPFVLQHYFIDNYWRELGVVTNKIYYFSNLYIEHMHWSNQKTKKDSLYEECEKMQIKDRIAFDKYRMEGGVRRDADKILNING